MDISRAIYTLLLTATATAMAARPQRALGGEEGPASVPASPVPGSPVPGSPTAASATAAGPTGAGGVFDIEPFQELIRQAILDELKPQYEDRKNWGHQGKVITGVKVKGKWFEPYLEKRTREVNDGLWQRYVVSLVEPAQNLRLRLEPAHAAERGRVAFSLLLESKMRGEAHIERWRKGIKTFNVSANGDLVVAARIDCDLGIRLEPGKLASDVVLDPRITAVDLRLVDLDLRRVSKLGHDVAHEIGDSITPIVARELDRREPKIVAKANAAIDKRRNRLRFSFDQFLKSGWSKFQTTIVGAPVATPAAKTTVPATTVPAALPSK